MKIATSILTVLTVGFYAFHPALAEEKDHDHDHAKIVAGPNGGRVITEVEPHLEFLVNKDRTVKITALDDHNKPTKIADQSVSIVAGKRSKPTKLAFTVKDGALVSDGALPAGNDFPVVLQIKPTKKGKKVTAKFNVDLNDCPTCKYKEYACTCEHSHDEKK